MNSLSNKTIAGVLAFSFLALSACGGGGNSRGTNVILSSHSVSATTGGWLARDFAEPSTLADQCAANQTGSQFTEKMWLRSWSNDTYLWYNEIDDQNPAGFGVIDYFDELKTNALTASGRLKDQFHFSMPTQEWQQLNQSGASVGYGINFHLQQSDPSSGVERKVTITYTDPDTPASEANIARGAVVIDVDGVNISAANDATSIAALNNGLFPATDGQQTTFTLQDLGQNETRKVTLTAKTVISTPVQNVKTLATNTGKVGYLQFNSHIATAEKGLVDAITSLKAENISDLILDLRYNGGGYLALASQLSYMIAGDATEHKVFEKLTFNDKHQNFDPVTGEQLTSTPFYDTSIGFNEGLLTAGHALPTLNLSRVYVLTSQNTCSASESLMNGLRGIDVEVIQIGSTTCGKPYGFYPTPNCGTTYFTVQFSGENDKGFGDYSDGFEPTFNPSFDSEVKGCWVEDDLTHALGDKNEDLVAAALSYRETANCPGVQLAKYLMGNKRSVITQDFILEDKRMQAVLKNNRLVNFTR
ncbi:MAG: peptidase [Alteromonadaceae bacterium]|nr:peptidase [Alteromonadaceae bacterium]